MAENGNGGKLGTYLRLTLAVCALVAVVWAAFLPTAREVARSEAEACVRTEAELSRMERDRIERRTDDALAAINEKLDRIDERVYRLVSER